MVLDVRPDIRVSIVVHKMKISRDGERIVKVVAVHGLGQAELFQIREVDALLCSGFRVRKNWK